MKSKAEKDIEALDAKMVELSQQVSTKTLENGQLQSELDVATRNAAGTFQQVKNAAPQRI